MDNEAHGPGELTDSKGCVYSFIWKKSYANGIGTLSFPDGRQYRGSFKDETSIHAPTASTFNLRGLKSWAASCFNFEVDPENRKAV